MHKISPIPPIVPLLDHKYPKLPEKPLEDDTAESSPQPQGTFPLPDPRVMEAVARATERLLHKK